VKTIARGCGKECHRQKFKEVKTYYKICTIILRLGFRVGGCLKSLRCSFLNTITIREHDDVFGDCLCHDLLFKESFSLLVWSLSIL
jgi:hypothetical protein